MRLFRQKYRDKMTGEYRESEKWYVGIMLNGREIRIPAFSDKRASDELGRKINDLAAFKAARRALPPDMARWLDTLYGPTRRRLARHGLIDRQSAASFKTLRDHLADYRTALSEQERTPDYVQKSCWRIERVIDGIGAQALPDLSAAAVSRYLAARRKLPRKKGGLSIKSANHYLGCVKGFCNWMIRDGRAGVNPVEYLEALNANTDRKHERRAMDPDELLTLLTATRRGPERHGMTAEARYWLYRLAVETGLRSGELRSLTRASFDLSDTTAATVTIAAKSAKNRKAATLPIRPATATDLTAYLADKLPLAAAFTMPRPEKVVVMLREDLAAAEIPYSDAAGCVADFHSLRASFATMLVHGGTDINTAKDLMRHSTIGMTADIYAKKVRRADAVAVEALPDFAVATAEALRATGTGENVGFCLPNSLPKSLPKPCTNRGAAIHRHAQVERAPEDSQVYCESADSVVSDDRELVSVGECQTHGTPPPRGFEPLSPA